MNSSPSLRPLPLRRWSPRLALVFGLAGSLSLLHQLLFHLAGKGIYWWWIFWGDWGDIFLSLFFWCLTACSLLVWFSSVHSKNAPRHRRSSLLFLSLIVIACCMFLCSALSVASQAIISWGNVINSVYIHKATLSYQGMIYHLVLKSVPRPDHVLSAYAVDLYQCDGSGWFCQRVQADMGRAQLFTVGDSEYIDPNFVDVQMFVDDSHTRLRICIDYFGPPSCIYSYPLPQETPGVESKRGTAMYSFEHLSLALFVKKTDSVECEICLLL